MCDSLLSASSSVVSSSVLAPSGLAIFPITSRIAGDSAIFAQIRSPSIRAARSAPASSVRYCGSMIGLSIGFADRREMLPRLRGFSRIGPMAKA